MAVTVARDPGAACPRLQSRLWALRRNPTGWLIDGFSVTLRSLRNNDWTRILGWPGYRVYRSEINEEAKALRLWVRRKSGERKLVCCGCGRSVSEIAEVCEREIRDLPCFEYRTTVVIELCRLRCLDCGVKTEKVVQLPSKAPSANGSRTRWGKPARARRRTRGGQAGGAGGEHSAIYRPALSGRQGGGNRLGQLGVNEIYLGKKTETPDRG